MFMRCTITFGMASIFALLLPVAALADAYDDLVKVQTAFLKAKSYHGEENFSTGRTTTVDYSGPDRWRVQPSPDVTELVIGSDVYMVHKGHATKMPFGGMIVNRIIKAFTFSADSEIKQSARDLGMQSLDGQSVHAYSYVSHGAAATLYVGSDSLPVQCVVKDKNLTTIVKYSKFNEPISIEAPQ
jgi:hypothetical protein